jgi:hypothetical protein
VIPCVRITSTCTLVGSLNVSAGLIHRPQDNPVGSPILRVDVLRVAIVLTVIVFVTSYCTPSDLFCYIESYANDIRKVVSVRVVSYTPSYCSYGMRLCTCCVILPIVLEASVLTTIILIDIIPVASYSPSYSPSGPDRHSPYRHRSRRMAQLPAVSDTLRAVLT